MKKFACFIGLLCFSLILFSQDQIKITHGPYLHNVGETSATIVWTTNKPAVSWVEIAPDDGTHFYAKEREKFFDSPLGKKQITKLHRITADNLSPATTYNFRVFSREVLKRGDNNQTLYGNVASSAVYKVEPLKFKTLDTSKKEIKFSVVNDIHADYKKLESLLKQAPKDADFLVLNGDMVSQMESEDQIMKGFLDTLVQYTKSSMPLFYARGNHESRGNFSEEFIAYFPTPTGKPYYTFRQGKVFFIVLDGGEDKPDSDIEYFDTANFDKYRSDQAKWLQSVIESDEYKGASARIVITHIPPAWGSWHGSVDFKKKFAPVLNGANVDVILSGHLHKHEFYPASSSGFEAPNVVNSNSDIMNVCVDSEEIKIDFVGADGKPSHPGKTFKLNSAKE